MLFHFYKFEKQSLKFLKIEQVKTQNLPKP